MRRSEHLEVMQALNERHAAEREQWAQAAAQERKELMELIESLVAELAGMPRMSTMPDLHAGPGFDTEEDEIQREHERLAEEIDAGLRARGLAPDPIVAS